MNPGERLSFTQGTTRRDFLAAFAGMAGSPLLARFAANADTQRLDLAPGQASAKVALAQSRMTVNGPEVHQAHTRELLEASLLRLTNTGTIRDAWHSIVRPDDIIGLKFNGSGQRVIGTTDAVAGIVVGSLVDAGWKASRIACIEAPESTTRRLGTLAPNEGFDRSPTRFASGDDQLASWVHQVTALISIPFLKTHNICTMTCALKNLSHAVVKHPARFHEHQCSPYIADIVAAPVIRNKLRLAIVDALRVVFADGPVPTSANLADAGGLVVARDLVAADAVSLAVLNDVRQKRGLPAIAASPEDIPYLVAAHRIGLGIAAPHGIDLVRIAP